MKLSLLSEASTTAALGRAAQAWCLPKTEKKVMDPELAMAFADLLDQAWEDPEESKNLDKPPRGARSLTNLSSDDVEPVTGPPEPLIEEEEETFTVGHKVRSRREYTNNGINPGDTGTIIRMDAIGGGISLGVEWDKMVQMRSGRMGRITTNVDSRDMEPAGPPEPLKPGTILRY